MTKPDIASIQEINIYKYENIEDYYIEGYDLILDQLYSTHSRARAAIYVANEVRYNRRLDLEVPGESMIFLTIHPHREKKFNIINHYRQWQLVADTGAIPNTGTPAAHLRRYNLVLDKWTKSLNENETIYNGDSNIDLDFDFSKT